MYNECMSWFSKILILFVFVFSLSFVSLVSVSAHEGHVHTETLGEITLRPSQTSGGAFTVDVYEDSGSEMVNAVQTNIMYPASLKVSTVSTVGSVFDIEAEQENSNGMVKIARGTVSPVSGSQKVATITFSGTGSPSEIKVSEDSAIIRSSDSKNIYAKSQNYYAAESVLTTESAVPMDETTAKTAAKTGFFAKITAWNNALWDKITGLFSKD